MNERERIREYAKASGLDVYGLGKDREKWEAAVERFALSIVKECVKVCSESGTPYHGLWYADQIKEHFFGVEE